MAQKEREQQDLNTRAMRLFIWSGPALIVAMLVAQLGLMGFIPPPSPDLTAEELTQIFIDRQLEIQIGTIIQCIFWSFWATWGVAITVYIRKMEGSFPLLTYASLALVGGGYVFFILIPMTWAVIAFRPEALDPSVIQIMNDWVWFDFLFTWPPFALWMIVIAIAVFNDHNTPRLFPRWVGYFNVWCAILIFPAGLIVFFRTGLFAYDGVGAFWIPFFVFFGWMCVMTWATLRVTTVTEARLSAEPDEDRPLAAQS